MTHARLLSGLLLLGLLGASSASGQVQRTFVSGSGSDSNPCSRPAPCRTFGQAISQTNSGGEVVVLDSAGYGPFSINKAVSIVSPPGVYAGIAVTSGVGITISAGASDTVILRGLTINCAINSGPFFVPTSGIASNSVGTLLVEGCAVNGFSNDGLDFVGNGNLEVSNSTFRSDLTGIGILVFGSSGSAQAAMDSVRIEGCATGLLAEPGSKVTVRNSIASHNETGFFALGGRALVELNLERCVASNNINGVFVDSQSLGGVRTRVSSCTITNNSRAGLNNLTGQGGQIFTRGNNIIEGNAIDIIGAVDSYTAK